MATRRQAAPPEADPLPPTEEDSDTPVTHGELDAFGSHLLQQIKEMITGNGTEPEEPEEPEEPLLEEPQNRREQEEWWAGAVEKAAKGIASAYRDDDKKAAPTPPQPETTPGTPRFIERFVWAGYDKEK